MGRDLDTSAHTPTLGYDRAAVDDFLEAATQERQKLEQQIEQSNLRLARARTALGTHRVMVAMLLDAQRELSAIRRDGERQAAAIIADAERQVRERTRSGIEAAPAEASLDSIDLRADASEPTAENVSISELPDEFAAWDAGDLSANPFATSGQDDEFFAYLRGALSDDEPLGPRSDDAVS